MSWKSATRTAVRLPRLLLPAVLGVFVAGSCGAGAAPGSVFAHAITTDADAPLVALDAASGQLRYRFYAERGADAARNIVPDFSRAGYHGGGVALPARTQIPVRRALSPLPQGDDHARIQAAIDEVSALAPDTHGRRGAVLLARGTYRISDTLRIRASGVVLRGEGRGTDGTVVVSTLTGPQGRIIEAGHPESAIPRAARDHRSTRIAMAYLPVGAMRVTVDSTEGYRVGDTIAVVREPNAAWVGPEGIDTARYGWKPKDYAMHYERVVTSVAGNTLGLDAPIVDAIEQRFGGGHVHRLDVARIAEAGIEDLQLQGNPGTGQENGTPDSGPYLAVRFAGIRDSWVRNVSVRFVSHGFTSHNGAHFNTFQDVGYLDPRYGRTQGARRYAFLYEGNASFNLTQRCHARHARHAFVTGARAPGPNVFLDCIAVDGSNDSGPHHRWATGTLYDNTQDQQLRAQLRRYSGSGHGWAGAQQMFWNSAAAHYVVQAPPFAMNWAVGRIGTRVPGKFPPEEPAGIVESPDQLYRPRSLYLQQLQDRLGSQAVEAISTPVQRQGLIATQLMREFAD